MANLANDHDFAKFKFYSSNTSRDLETQLATIPIAILLIDQLYYYAAS